MIELRESRVKMKKLNERKIKEFRKRLNMTQQKLAEEIGVTAESVCQYESGKRSPSVDKLPLLAKALECEITDFFEKE